MAASALGVADDDYQPDASDDAETSDYQDRIEQAQRPAPAPSALGRDSAPTPQRSTTVGPKTQAVLAAQQAHRDAFDPSKVVIPKDAVGYAAAPAPEQRSWWNDLGQTAWVSTLKMGDSIVQGVGAANAALMQDPSIAQHVEATSRKMGDYIADQTSKMSPEWQQAMTASLFGSEGAPTPGQVGWGHYVASNVMQFAPQGLMALLPGGVAAKVGGKLVGYAAMAATGAGFGMQNMGDLYRTVTDGIGNASELEMRQNPVYAQLRDSGLDDTAARKQMIASAAPMVAAAGFGIGAAAGVGTGGLLRGGAATAGRGIAARAGLGAAEGAGLMGGQGAANEAVSEKGQGQSLDPSKIAMAAAEGAVPGVVMGGLGGAVHKGAAPTPDAKPTAGSAVRGTTVVDEKGVPADHAAAMQGEMFLPGQMSKNADAKMPSVQPDMFGGPDTQVTPPTQAPPLPVHTPTSGVTPPPDPQQGQSEMFLPQQMGQPAPMPTRQPSLFGEQQDQVAPPATAPPMPEQLRAQDARASAVAAAPTEAPQAEAPPVAAPVAAPTAAPAPAAAPVAAAAPAPAPVVPSTLRKPAQKAAPKAAPKAAEAKASAETKAPAVTAAPTPGEIAPKPGEIAPVVARTGRETSMGEVAPTAETKPAENAAGTPAPAATQAPSEDGSRATTVTPENEAGTPAPKPASKAVIATEAPAPEAKPKTAAEKRAEAKAKLAGVATTPAPTGDLRAGLTRKAPATPVVEPAKSPAGVRQAAAATQVSAPEALDRTTRRAQLKRELTPVGKNDLSGHVNRVLDQVDSLMQLRRIDEAEAWKQWGEEHRGVIAGTKTRGADLADTMSKRAGGRGIERDIDASAVAREDTQRGGAEATERKVIEDAAPDDREPVANAAESETERDETAQGRPDSEDAPGEAGEAGETSEGQVAAYNPDQERELSKGSNTTRVGERALEAVQQGTQTPEEAMHAFGAKASGSGGAARSHNMLSDYVADRIAHYSDPATAERLRAQIDKLNEAKQALPTRQGAGRDAATQKHSAITAKIAAAEAELERTRPEHVAELRDIHDEMKQHADAVQEAADKAAQETRTQSKETKAVAAQHGLQPKTVEQMRGLVPSIRDTATVRALHAIEDAHAGGNSDPASMARIAKANGVSLADIQRFHDKLSAMPAEDVPKVKALLREAYPPVAEPKIYRRAKSETAGASRVMRQPLLDAIRTGSDDHEYSSGVPLHDLLRSIVDNQDARTQSPVLHDLARRLLKLAPDIPVFDERHFDRLGLDEDEARNTHGVYVPEHDSIAIDTSGATPDTLQTVLHEALHSVTARYLADAEEGKSGAYRALQAIGSELYTAMQNDPTGALLHGLTADDIHYALSDLHELHTMLMTNPSVQAAMARLPASDTLKAALKREGYGPMRTLWDGFRNWVRKAVGLGANSDTLLDHALHVGTGIMDEAHIYDGLARRTAEPGRMLLKATAGSDRDVWDALRAGGSAVRDRMANLGDSARKVVLNGTTFDAMHDWNKELFEPGRTAIIGNAFTRLRDAMRGEVARRGEFAGRYGSKFSDISDRGRKLSREDDQRMGQLMVDATIAKARLGTDAPDLHKHLKTADERAALADVQARFDALPKDQQQLYRDTRDFYDQTYTAERNARLDAITRAALPGATEDQLTALRGVIRNNAKLDAFLASNTDPALEKAFGPGWGTKRGIARAIGKLHGMGRVQGDYFPLRRTGDYIVTHGDRENPRDYHVEMFEKRSDAEDRRAALAEAGRPDVSPVKIKGENTMRDIVPDSQVLRDLDSALRADPALKGHAEAVGDIARQIAMEHATRGEQTRTRMSRKGVLGANAEWRRNLAREYGGATGRYASMKQAPAKAQALADMRTIIADLGSPGRPEGAQIRAQAVFDEAQKRVGAGNDAQTQLSGASRWMNNFGYIQTLMSLSHMATNTLELHTTAGGLLASRYGSRGAFALAKAMREVAPGMTGKMGGGMLKAMSQGLRDADWHMADYARDQFIRAGADKDRTTRLFDAVRESGLIDHSFSKEAKRIAEGGTADGTNRANRLFNRVMDFNGIGQHALDVANKSAVLKAAYDLEYAKNGGDHDAAAAHAIDVISKSTPNYQAYNKASIASARGPLGALGVPLMQFRNYGIHMTNVLTVLARQAAHGDKESMKALAGVIGLHALTAGVFAGTPVGDLLRYGGGAYDMANGAKEPHDYEAAGRRHLSDWLGPEIGELVSRGLPHALGIDVHRRVGLSNMLEMPDLQSFDAKGFATALGKMATPASIGDVGDIFAGASKLIQDHDPSGLSALLPREFRDVSKAVQLARKGVTTQTGKPVLGADKLGTGDIIAQGLGFQPSRVSEAREGRATMMETIREEGEARGKLIKAFTEASDAGDRSAVRAKVNAYNAEHRQRPITMSQLLQAKQKGSTTVGTFGVKVPKGSQAAQSGRFANVQ